MTEDELKAMIDKRIVLALPIAQKIAAKQNWLEGKIVENPNLYTWLLVGSVIVNLCLIVWIVM